MSRPGPAPDEAAAHVQTAAREDLRTTTLTAVRLVSMSRIAAEVLGLASTIVLARLISPEQFGRAVVTYILFEVGAAIVSDGFAAPLVQRASIERSHVRAALGLSLVLAAALAASVLLLAPVVVPPLLGADAVGLFQLAAPAFLLACPAAIGNAVLARDMRFTGAALVDIAAVSAGIVFAVTGGALGWGAAALVGARVAAMAASGVGMAAVARLPPPGFDRRALRDIASFGVPSAAAGVLWNTQRNVDFLIVGATLGPTQTGIYYRAFNLAIEYQAKVTSIMQRLALPVLSRAESLHDMHALRFRIVRVHTVMIFPLLALLFALAPVLIPWVFGPAWEAAVEPTRILALAAFAYPISAGLGALVLAAGQPRALLIASAMTLAGYVTAIAVGTRWGITGVCTATLLFLLVQVPATHYFLLHRRIGLSVSQMCREVLPALGACGPLLLVSLPLAEVLPDAGVPAAVVLLVTALAGGAAYLASLALAAGDAWADVRLVVHAVLPRRVANLASERMRA